MHPADVLKELAARQRSIAEDILLVRGRCCSFEDVVNLIKAPRCKLLLTGLIGANNEDM